MDRVCVCRFGYGPSLLKGRVIRVSKVATIQLLSDFILLILRIFQNVIRLLSMANKKEDDEKICREGHILEEFKEVEEIKGLIDSLKDIYNDQISVETAVERFTCT